MEAKGRAGFGRKGNDKDVEERGKGLMGVEGGIYQRPVWLGPKQGRRAQDACIVLG